jgi:hypothetical protein
MAPRTGRWTNQLVIIPIPYNPLLFPDKKPGTKIKKRRSVLLTTNWYQKALKYQQMLHSGIVKSKAELARKEGLSRARVTQILNLMNLAPEIRNYLNFTADQNDLKILTERRLREIVKITNHQLQIRRFRELIKQVDKP